MKLPEGMEPSSIQFEFEFDKWRLRVCFLAAAMNCREVLRVAIQGGAKNLGRDDVGQITPGFAADFVAWRTDTLGAPPFAFVLRPRKQRYSHQMYKACVYRVMNCCAHGQDAWQ